MKRPNFLFIMTDTQATNMVGCYTVSYTHLTLPTSDLV